MPVPALNQFGVLPSGTHECSWAEIELVFATSDHRRSLRGDFKRFRGWLDGQPLPNYILLDGGFTTDKVLPKDIDVVFDLTGSPEGTIRHWFQVFLTQRPYLKDSYRVDFWVYAPGTPKDLRAFFEYVRPEEAIRRGMSPEDRKGLLKVSP